MISQWSLSTNFFWRGFLPSTALNITPVERGGLALRALGLPYLNKKLAQRTKKRRTRQ